MENELFICPFCGEETFQEAGFQETNLYTRMVCFSCHKESMWDKDKLRIARGLFKEEVKIIKKPSKKRNRRKKKKVIIMRSPVNH